jgi:hypothetical protein
LENIGTYFWCNHHNQIYCIKWYSNIIRGTFLYISILLIEIVIFNETTHHTHNSQIMNST